MSDKASNYHIALVRAATPQRQRKARLEAEPWAQEEIVRQADGNSRFGAALDAVAARHRGRVEFAGIGVGNCLLLSVNALAGAHLGNDGRLVDPMTSTL